MMDQSPVVLFVGGWVMYACMWFTHDAAAVVFGVAAVVLWVLALVCVWAIGVQDDDDRVQ